MRPPGWPLVFGVIFALSLAGLAFPSAQASGGILFPPHFDRGHDADSDGIFDYLVVEVSLLVSETGILRLGGQGSWINEPFGSAFNLSLREPGFQTVLLYFGGGLIWASGVDGPYTVELSLYDENADLISSGSHTTRPYSHLDFEGPAVSFTPPHADFGLDADGDGLFNFLVVEANVFITDAATYEFSARIGWSGLSGWNRTRLETGPQTVTLRISGERLVADQLDGPYTVRLSARDPLQKVGDRDQFLTDAYSYLDFDDPEEGDRSAAFAPPHADYGLDTDGNGKFDHLVVAVQLDVGGRGSYSIKARLPLGERATEAFNTTFLQVGQHTVHLYLDGAHIRTAEVDGPYTVQLSIGNRRETHVTANYSHLDFQNASAVLIPPYTDHGEDVDANGLYDFLVITATVNVTQAATYKVTGFLQLPSASYCCAVWAYNATHLETGIQTVSLWFSGIPIRTSEVDGPYEATLRIDASDGLVVVQHVTAGYSHLEFDDPAALLSPPHSDFGRDLDRDGRFELLLVDVGVEVRRAGSYRVSGVLSFDLLWNDITQNVTWLDAGQKRVRLWFYGHRANLSGADGPYSVRLSLERCEHECIRLGEGDHQTKGYSHRNFQDPTTRSLRASPVAVPAAIDGTLEDGEWTDASVVDLSRSLGSTIPAFLLAQNDDEFLYVAFDAVGDITEGALDTARIAFDTGNDGVKTVGREDEFVHGGQAPNGQGHYVIGSENWRLEHTLYDLDPAKDPGIESAWGFGPTERSMIAHRVYEFMIPLSLLGLTPGETVGFIAGGHSPTQSFGPGLWDSTSGRFSSWPVGRRGGMFLSEYATLTLADTKPITISAPVEAGYYASHDVVVAWSASDVGTGIDRFLASLDDGPPVELGPNVRDHAFLGLEDGLHRVNVTAFDKAGYSRTDTVFFVVDATPPTVSIPIAARHNIFHIRDLIVFFMAEDETSGIDRIEVSLDGGPVAILPPEASGHVLKGLPDGFHTITVTATDNAGNSQSDSAEFTVDTDPFSPTGPYGPIPLVATFLTVGGSLIILLFLLRRRLGSR